MQLQQIVASDANLQSTAESWSGRDPWKEKVAGGFLEIQKTQALKCPMNPVSGLITKTELD